ncbi:MAG: EF-hand domain-containing protein [Lachnospiraceae bacterium]|nr:EF-hand domain-containing protein [Lachnospiraceae bacterium]
MINSISSNQQYQYQNYQNRTKTSSNLEAELLNISSTSLEDFSSTVTPVTSEEYSASDFMEMMKNGKSAPPKPEEVDSDTVSEYDTDGDGVLSAEEYSAMMEAYKADKKEQSGDISSIDTDGDGTISTDEYDTMISEMGIKDALTSDEFFNLYDTNEDGEISADEMPEPGTVGASTASSTETDTTDIDSTNISAEYRKLIMQALVAYESNYESMFEQADGPLLSNQA